jgi:alpha-tubulin suppressor-like RCC1 family protein
MSDGTVWAWGSNFFGQLGDGTSDKRSKPVQMKIFGGKIIAIAAGFAHSLVLRDDGQIFGCGDNNMGRWVSVPP